jgi:NAD(P)-dependent dehydrogenase (short-subunit alcohol dehydrogenase family)
MELEGKVAVVVGISSAIGQAIAMKLNESGVDVIGTTRRTYLVGQANVFMDLADPDSIKRAFVDIRTRYSAVDILVNAAGVNRNSRVFGIQDDIEKIFSVNFYGPVRTCMEVGEKMIRLNCGRIINISSIIGDTGAFGASVYAASKAALNSFTKSLAKELGRDGVTVNAIALGYTETGMIRDVPKPIVDRIVRDTPTGRLGTAQDVAELVLYLCRASWMTGQVIRLDGGYSG